MCEALNAGGVAFADYDPADGLVRITDGSSIPGSAPLPPAIDLNLLPACVLRRLQCGFACGAVDPQSGTGKILDISKSRSLLIAPIRSEGELVGIAVAADSQSRNWLPSEADLFFECVDRAWLLLKGALATKNKDEAEAHLRQILAVSPHLNWQASATNEAIFMDERWADYTGLPLKDLSGSWTEFTHPADAAALWSAWTLALKTNTPFEKEIRLRRHDGVYKWFLVRGVPFDDSKHGRSWVGTCTDIDGRMRAEQSSRDLVIEMDHRVKNILAVVQSLAHQSFTEGDPGQIKRTLKSRIAALAHAHGTPSMDEWQTQSLQATLASLLDGFDLPSQNWSIEGDDIPLPVESVSTLALAIHELASETARYGGERSSTAKIDIVVRNDPFRFDWKETCPLGIIPWPDNSFRTRLLGAAFKRLFDAEVQMEVAPNAVTFSAGKS
jgi:PAS domain S-box-containing protein